MDGNINYSYALATNSKNFSKALQTPVLVLVKNFAHAPIPEKFITLPKLQLQLLFKQ